ncbi:hypothetical protein ZIOFF_046403 [Zingiber officinale]|uniref:Uncharacterized protein n=1 Tax=Zingiber officinale TaxID=94328 RepID=A0A8J5KW64_ZINOF|nr:hypothetical protein ZIOFF_046403 [Zingiber officinale]
MTPLPNRAQRAKKPLRAQRRGGAIAVGLLALLLVGMILVATFMNSNGSAGSLAQSDRKSERNHVVVVASDVVFIAHGCNCRAAKFAVITVSSLGRCWSIEKDVDIAKGILQWWIENHELQKLPVTALGASSGGYFVSALAKEVNFSNVALMILAGCSVPWVFQLGILPLSLSKTSGKFDDNAQGNSLLEFKELGDLELLPETAFIDSTEIEEDFREIDFCKGFVKASYVSRCDLHLLAWPLRVYPCHLRVTEAVCLRSLLADEDATAVEQKIWSYEITSFLWKIPAASAADAFVFSKTSEKCSNGTCSTARNYRNRDGIRYQLD